ncbi:hypothetical protein MBLNU459_g1167t1 [Dothideomycetes sp. NU459]
MTSNPVTCPLLEMQTTTKHTVQSGLTDDDQGLSLGRRGSSWRHAAEEIFHSSISKAKAINTSTLTIDNWRQKLDDETPDDLSLSCGDSSNDSVADRLHSSPGQSSFLLRTTSRATASLRRTLSTSHSRRRSLANIILPGPPSPTRSAADEETKVNKRLSFSSVRALTKSHQRTLSRHTSPLSQTSETSEPYTFTNAASAIHGPREQSPPPVIQFEPDTTDFFQSLQDSMGQDMGQHAPLATAPDAVPVRRLRRTSAAVDIREAYERPYVPSRTTNDHWRSSQVRLPDAEISSQSLEEPSPDVTNQSVQSSTPASVSKASQTLNKNSSTSSFDLATAKENAKAKAWSQHVYDLTELLVDRAAELPFDGMRRADAVAMSLVGIAEIIQNFMDSSQHISSYEEHHFIPSDEFVRLNVPEHEYTWARSLAEYQRRRKMQTLNTAPVAAQKVQFLKKMHRSIKCQDSPSSDHTATVVKSLNDHETANQQPDCEVAVATAIDIATRPGMTVPDHVPQSRTSKQRILDLKPLPPLPRSTRPSVSPLYPQPHDCSVDPAKRPSLQRLHLRGGGAASDNEGDGEISEESSSDGHSPLYTQELFFDSDDESVFKGKDRDGAKPKGQNIDDYTLDVDRIVDNITSSDLPADSADVQNPVNQIPVRERRFRELIPLVNQLMEARQARLCREVLDVAFPERTQNLQPGLDMIDPFDEQQPWRSSDNDVFRGEKSPRQSLSHLAQVESPQSSPFETPEDRHARGRLGDLAEISGRHPHSSSGSESGSDSFLSFAPQENLAGSFAAIADNASYQPPPHRPPLHPAYPWQSQYDFEDYVARMEAERQEPQDDTEPPPYMRTWRREDFYPANLRNPLESKRIRDENDELLPRVRPEDELFRLYDALQALDARDALEAGAAQQEEDGAEESQSNVAHAGDPELGRQTLQLLADAASFTTGYVDSSAGISNHGQSSAVGPLNSASGNRGYRGRLATMTTMSGVSSESLPALRHMHGRSYSPAINYGPVTQDTALHSHPVHHPVCRPVQLPVNDSEPANLRRSRVGILHKGGWLQAFSRVKRLLPKKRKASTTRPKGEGVSTDKAPADAL